MSVMCISESEQYASSCQSLLSDFFSLMLHGNTKVIEELIHPTQAEIKRFVRDLSGQEMKSPRQTPVGFRATTARGKMTLNFSDGETKVFHCFCHFVASSSGRTCFKCVSADITIMHNCWTLTRSFCGDASEPRVLVDLFRCCA